MNFKGNHCFSFWALKAGGLGFNLTCANYVLHYDRWWNPAVERQAEDRTHRIGQLRNKGTGNGGSTKPESNGSETQRTTFKRSKTQATFEAE